MKRKENDTVKIWTGLKYYSFKWRTFGSFINVFLAIIGPKKNLHLFEGLIFNLMAQIPHLMHVTTKHTLKMLLNRISFCSVLIWIFLNGFWLTSSMLVAVFTSIFFKCWVHPFFNAWILLTKKTKRIIFYCLLMKFAQIFFAVNLNSLLF